ncbi:MAG: GspH/FimT family pseudopilin [Syntrophales bacterium]|nr:GspH/FimT family pseudopilin [Syntrophales bacterium]
MRSQKGFTLVELMIVVAVMAIMSAFAFPAFQDWMVKNRLNGAARQVMSDLMEARMKAVKENTTVTVARLNGSDHEYKISTASEEKTIDIKLNYHDVDITSFSSISFSSRGTASPGGIALTNSSGSKSITISSAGRVKIN